MYTQFLFWQLWLDVFKFRHFNYLYKWTLGKGFGIGVVLLQAALNNEQPGSPVNNFHVTPSIFMMGYILLQLNIYLKKY